MNQTIDVPRELLERVIGEGAGTSLNAMRELRAILAAPRQPEGDAASILLPALRQYMHNDGSGLLAGYEYERTQQIVADLRQECERLRAGQEPVAYITGYHGGRCIIEPVNRAAVLPSGMALYAAPSPPLTISTADIQSPPTRTEPE